jgi:hypothetical protein
MKNKLAVFGSFLLGMVPVVALAQVTGGINSCVKGMPVRDITSLLCKIGDILNAVVPILIALGVVYFVWGVITFVIANDEEAKTTGRNRIIAGIIGLAVIIGLWGLVKILTNTFGVGGNQPIDFPTTPY